MLEWLKQRVISWFLSRHVGKWIAVDRQNLHGETHSDVWCAYFLACLLASCHCALASFAICITDHTRAHG